MKNYEHLHKILMSLTCWEISFLLSALHINYLFTWKKKMLLKHDIDFIECIKEKYIT